LEVVVVVVVAVLFVVAFDFGIVEAVVIVVTNPVVGRCVVVDVLAVAVAVAVVAASFDFEKLHLWVFQLILLL